MNSSPPRCYYCDSEDFGLVDGYEHHIVTPPPNLPGYPGPADIKYYRLEKQDMSWKRNKSLMWNGDNHLTQPNIHKSEDRANIEIDITDDHE